MGHRLGEMNDLLLQRELRVETQIYNLSNQINSVLNASDALRREKLLPRSGEGVTAGSSSASTSVKPNLEKPNPAGMMKPILAGNMKPSTSRPATQVRIKEPVLAMPDTEHKPARVQMNEPHDSSSAVQSTVILTSTRDQGVDPVTINLDSSTKADLSSTNDTLGSQTDDAAYVSAQAMLSGPSSLYLTADNGVPSGKPCASSTRKKEQETMDLSVQATQSSDDATRDLEPKEEFEVIATEQLRFYSRYLKCHV